MKTIETLFETLLVKESKPRTPISKLKAGLRRELTNSVYKFKIMYNRVFYGKTNSFPKFISRDQWLHTAEQVWNEEEMEGKVSIDPHTNKKIKLKLLDPIKANQ